MERTVYCNCYYCEHYEDGKCMSETLHLRRKSGCQEFVASEAKLEEKINKCENLPLYYDECESKPTMLICK